MNLNDMTKDEKNLLLYFETCAVDQGGLVSIDHMNAEDMAIAKRFNESGFIRFGRLASECLPKYSPSTLGNGSTHWCELSDEAWNLVHEERRDRYKRINEKRSWYTTKEKRERV